MFHRVMLHACDPEAFAGFYDLVLGTPGIGRTGDSDGVTERADAFWCAGVDHLWMRVADVAASRRFYAAVGPRAGFAVRTDLPERVQLKGASGSFSVVAGDALTEHAQLTFAAAGEEAVRGREQDPDGNVVEIV